MVSDQYWMFGDCDQRQRKSRGSNGSNQSRGEYRFECLESNWMKGQGSGSSKMKERTR